MDHEEKDVSNRGQNFPTSLVNYFQTRSHAGKDILFVQHYLLCMNIVVND